MDDIQDTLNERGERYGEFPDHALLSQRLKVVMRTTIGWTNLTPDQGEALEMIAHKIARILNGDPNYVDSWLDVSGYATLIVNELNKEKK
jgi:hypothetical protein